MKRAGISAAAEEGGIGEGRIRVARSRRVVWLGAVVAALGPLAVEAQTFRIGWFTVDGGGQTSSGGVFTVSGTIGQADAGELQGGAYHVTGGFWGIVKAVQTPGAPRLLVTRDQQSGTVTISWTLPDDGWVLEQSPTLGEAPTPWSTVPPATYQSDGTRRFITVPNPVGRRFYRLQQP